MVRYGIEDKFGAPPVQFFEKQENSNLSQLVNIFLF
jgi:hypothetical protein